MSDDINQLVQAASTSLFSPESLDDIRCRLSFIEASECNCGEGPHENAIHDLIKDDVPVLFHVIHCLAAELEAARAEVERLRGETSRQYVAAYQADNGNIIPLAEINCIEKYAATARAGRSVMSASASAARRSSRDYNDETRRRVSGRPTTARLQRRSGLL